MIGNVPMTSAEESVMNVFLDKIVTRDEHNVAYLRKDVAAAVAAILFADEPARIPAFVELMDRAVIERGMDAPSAFFPTFFP